MEQKIKTVAALQQLIDMRDRAIAVATKSILSTIQHTVLDGIQMVLQLPESNILWVDAYTRDSILTVKAIINYTPASMPEFITHFVSSQELEELEELEDDEEVEQLIHIGIPMEMALDPKENIANFIMGVMSGDETIGTTHPTLTPTNDTLTADQQKLLNLFASVDTGSKH